MQLEYFQLIDRIIDLNLDAKSITVEAQVPQQNTIFEGHFPGYPIMPGVLLTEAMAQSSGWLLLGVMKFERMPFLAMVKEAKMRGFVSPGQLLTIEAKIEHEGSGFAVTSGCAARAVVVERAEEHGERSPLVANAAAKAGARRAVGAVGDAGEQARACAPCAASALPSAQRAVAGDGAVHQQ